VWPLIKVHKKTTPKGVAQTGRPSAAETKKAKRQALPENTLGYQSQGYTFPAGRNFDGEKLTQFFNDLPNVSSLQKIMGHPFDLEEVLLLICQELEVSLKSLSPTRFETMLDEYHTHLFRKDKPSTFEYPNGERFMGYIRGVSHNGQLQIEQEDALMSSFSLKEIKLLY